MKSSTRVLHEKLNFRAVILLVLIFILHLSGCLDLERPKLPDAGDKQTSKADDEDGENGKDENAVQRSDSDIDTDTGTDTDSDTDTDTDTDTDSDTDTDADTDTDTDTDADTDTDNDIDNDTDSDNDSYTHTDTHADTDSDSETTSESDEGVVIGKDWVTLPAGSFWMGSPEGTCPEGYTGTCASEPGRSGSETLHYVELTRRFELMRMQVTQGYFVALMEGWNPSNFGPNGSYGKCGLDCPVELVSWYDALAYANALSSYQGLTPCYKLATILCVDGTNVGSNAARCMNTMQGGINSATVVLNGVTSVYDCTGYRLPTEAEWEYAARAGTDTAFYKGGITNTYRAPLDRNLDAIGWYGGNSSFEAYSTFDCTDWYTGATTCGPQVAGSKAANAWGLYDMSGNVWDWAWDWYYSTYPAGTTASPLVDPEGPSTASDRVIRGGSWYNSAYYCRSASRLNRAPWDRNFVIGFRLSRSK